MSFITNEGRVAICLEQHREITTGEVARMLELTERSVVRIIDKLIASEVVRKRKLGTSNRNVYDVDWAKVEERFWPLSIGGEIRI